jgi:hypothetical protein
MHFAEVTGDGVRGTVVAVELFANPHKQRIETAQEVLWRKTAPAWIPHPFMARGTDTPGYQLGIGDTDQSCGNHVAVFEGSRKARSLLRIIS